MASKPVTLEIKPRGKRIPRLPEQTTTYLQASGREVYKRVAADSKFSINRLRITTDDGKLLPNDNETTIDSVGLKDGSAIQIKDLGPQISWRGVFVIEYLGPLLIHPIVYFLRPYIYKNAPAEPTELQTLTLWMICLHFIKRELEGIFLHRFSAATMPFSNVFKNSAHYWLLSGILVAYFTYSPTSWAGTHALDPRIDYPAIALYVFGELANFNSHLVLRSLRSAGGTERGIPKGFGFNWVTCPNYFFEAIAWTGIILVSRSWTTVVFLAFAAYTMALWAWKKEHRYRKEMGGRYKKKRYAMIPFIV